MGLFNFHTSDESFKNKKLCCSHKVSGTHSVSIGSSLTLTSVFVTVCKISFASGLLDVLRMDNNDGSLLKVLDKCSERSHSAAANNSYEIFERNISNTNPRREILEMVRDLHLQILNKHISSHMTIRVSK